MKRLIFIVLFAISVLSLNSCKKDTPNGEILINFINKTGAEIKSVKADNILIGNIADNRETGFISFEKFGTDTQMPDCNFEGLFNNETLKSTSVFYWCGTEKAQLQPGQYNIEVDLSTNGSERYFHLRFR